MLKTPNQMKSTVTFNKHINLIILQYLPFSNSRFLTKIIDLIRNKREEIVPINKSIKKKEEKKQKLKIKKKQSMRHDIKTPNLAAVAKK